MLANLQKVSVGVLIVALALSGRAVAANVHPGKVPTEVSLPAAADQTFAFFEGETSAQSQGDAFPGEQHQDATYFCDGRQPDDQFWAGPIGYDGCRAATRGSANSYTNHSFEWGRINERLDPGVYDVYVRANIAPDGAARYSLQTPGGEQTGLDDIENNKQGISWFRLGSVNIDQTDTRLVLKVDTTSSPVWLDTMLLVSPEHVQRSMGLERVPGSEAWASSASVLFSAEHGELVYRVSNAAADAAVTYTLKDESGRLLVEDAPAEPSPQVAGDWQIQLPHRGYFEVGVKVHAPGVNPAEASVSAAVIGAPLDESLRSRSRFGVWNVHGDNQLAVLAGGRWNRRMTAFFKTEQDAVGEGPWVRAPEANEKDGLKQVGVYGFGLPAWLMDLPENSKRPSYGNAFYPATDPDRLADVVSYHVSQTPMPDVIEVYNEPLAHWHGTDEQLIDFVRAVRNGLAAVDPKFKLIGPCLYSIRLNDLARLAGKGLFDYLDGVSMHAYVNGTPPEGEFVQRMHALREFVATSGRPDMPIYLTEFGWTRSDGTWQEPVDALTQARYCARSLILGMAEDIDVLIYFALQFKTKNVGEAGFSLVDPDDRLSSAYVTFATVSKFFAAAEPIGSWAITPTSHLVLAERDGQILAAIWDSERSRAIRLPWAITDAMTMTGAPLAERGGSELQISPSPIYLVLDAPALSDIQTESSIDTTIGDGELAAIAEGMLADIAMDTPPGAYTAFRYTAGGWVAKPVQLYTPVSLVRTSMRWPNSDDQPHLEVMLRSNIDDSDISVEARLGTQGAGKMLSIPPRSIRSLRLPMDNMVPGVQMDHVVHLGWHTGDGEVTSFEERLSSTLTWATSVDDAEGAWPSGLVNADFTDWAPFPASDVAGDWDRTDCSAAFRAMYGEAGLRLEFVVTDDEYAPPLASFEPKDYWARDSIQLAFDLDVDTPWTAGVVGAGLAGHRVFEFTVAERPDSSGNGLVFRHRSYTDSLPPNQVAQGCEVRIVRNGDAVTYDVFFPWEELAVQTAYKPGDAIGIAIAVNDIDPQRGRGRHGLRLFRGIVQSKDAKQLGKLWLR